MREVTLEILRHGPPNNQLLSPLTRYLALCGNHQAVTLELPYEHSQFLIRLRGLRYRDTSRTREMQLAETGKELGQILAKIPGLIRELGDCPGGSTDRAGQKGEDQGAREQMGGEPLTHLRLILSANELALLPFELAQSPNGFPGAGQPLALQTDTPVCITREVRRVREESAPFDRKPRILFLAASPPGLAEVPVRAHLLALRKAISPWLEPYNPEKPEEVKREVGRHLTVVLSADVDSVERVCSAGEYTHVHILAHGRTHRKGATRGFGLAFHDPRNRDRVDVVDGSRLTTLLRPRIRADKGLVCPHTVTIASCDSANVSGSMVGAAASVAHSLHEGGVPLVAAAQFPLSFAASVIITQMLYEGLLWGEDPRILFDRLRRSLLARVPTTHDWASLVAYASFPADLDRQLAQTRVRQAERSIDAALKHAGSSIVGKSVTLALSLKKIEQAKKRLREVADAAPESTQQVWIWGRLASTEKQEAEVRLRNQGGVKSARAGLKEAQDCYRRAFEADPSQSWGIVQSIVIGCVLDKEAWDDNAWSLARLLAERQTKSLKASIRTWSYADLMELHLLRWMVQPPGADRKAESAKALMYADKFLEVTDKDSFHVFSNWRQIERYKDFFRMVAQWDEKWDTTLAQSILDKLPSPAPAFFQA